MAIHSSISAIRSKLVLKTLVEFKLVAERLAERTGLNKSG
jgi:hypothetical protein